MYGQGEGFDLEKFIQSNGEEAYIQFVNGLTLEQLESLFDRVDLIREDLSFKSDCAELMLSDFYRERDLRSRPQEETYDDKVGKLWYLVLERIRELRKQNNEGGPSLHM